MVSLFGKIDISRTMDYSQGFGRNLAHSLRSVYSTLEGAMKLKFVPFLVENNRPRFSFCTHKPLQDRKLGQKSTGTCTQLVKAAFSIILVHV